MDTPRPDLLESGSPADAKSASPGGAQTNEAHPEWVRDPGPPRGRTPGGPPPHSVTSGETPAHEPHPDDPAPAARRDARRGATILGAGPDLADPDGIEKHFEEHTRRIRDHRLPDSQSAWDKLLQDASTAFDAMADKPCSGVSTKHGPNPYEGWNGARFSLCEFLRLCVCGNRNVPTEVIANHRETIFRFLCHMFDVSATPRLLGSASPDPRKAYRSDPGSMAVAAQSLRCHAITTLVGLMFRVEEASDTDQGDLLARIRGLLEKFLDRETYPAPMHPFGYHFRDFFVKDPAWAKSLADRIFPTDPSRRLLYVGGWTGFLSRFPVREMFADSDVRALYRRGLETKTDDAEKFKPTFYHDPEEGIAIHLALAYFELQAIDFADDLLVSFREGADPAQMAKFVAYGGDLLPNYWTPKTEETWERARTLWEWILGNRQEREVLVEFGTWINIEAGFPTGEMIRLAHETLTKTSGELSWYPGISGYILEFARTEPGRAQEMLDMFLRNPRVDENSRLATLMHGGWIDAARHLNSLPATRGTAAPMLAEIEEARRPLARAAQ